MKAIEHDVLSDLLSESGVRIILTLNEKIDEEIEDDEDWFFNFDFPNYIIILGVNIL